MSAVAVDHRFITPFQGALLHLLLIGIPVRFGLNQINPFGKWVGTPSPCSIYEDYQGSCSPLEIFLIRDLGYRFVLHYELAIVACFIMAREVDDTNFQIRRLHRTLIMTSFLTLLSMATLQHFGDAAFESDFFAFNVLNYLWATGVSVWVSKPASIPASRRLSSWSAPGMAIFGGVAASSMLAIAFVQVLMSPEGIKKYIAVSHHDEITPIVKTTFTLTILHTVIHAMILRTLRHTMTVNQLRATCLHNAVLNVCLPLFWMPEISNLLSVQQNLIIGLRAALASAYILGYLFAGKADNVGRIMSSEKDA